MMKRSIIGLAIAAALLSGCEEPVTSQEQQEYVEKEAASKVRAELALDEKELKMALQQLQQADPTVIDLYYSANDAGEKQLHIVRKEDPAATSSPPPAAAPVAVTNTTATPAEQNQHQASASSSVTDMVWPVVGGMAAGALVANMISKGGVNNYASSHPPASSSHYEEEDRRKHRNVGGASYSSALMSRSRANITSAPNFRSNLRQSVSSSRAISARSGAIFSGSSARAGGYSAGS